MLSLIAGVGKQNCRPTQKKGAPEFRPHLISLTTERTASGMLLHGPKERNIISSAISHSGFQPWVISHCSYRSTLMKEGIY